MKIGIVTLPLHTNYGGILQAYALQTVLERMGHEVIVLDRPQHWNYPAWWRIPKVFVKRLIQKIRLKNNYVFFSEYKYNKTYPIVSQHTQPFIDKHIHNRVVDNLSLIDNKEFDAILVGSDQIWRNYYYRPVLDPYLKFAEDWTVKRIAYAVSFGNTTWRYNKELTKECAKYAQKFDDISVREDTGVMMCKKHLGVNAIHVLDPTMLLTADDYTYLVPNRQAVSPGKILNYVLDESEEVTKIQQYIINKVNKPAFRVNSKIEDLSKPVNERIQPPVEQWLKGFDDAELVITDSFHACVFSILFHKQFFVIGNEKRGYTRFESLLKIFGLENHLIKSIQNYEAVCENCIDYTKVDTILGEWRKISYDFLVNTLDNNK